MYIASLFYFSSYCYFTLQSEVCLDELAGWKGWGLDTFVGVGLALYVYPLAVFASFGGVRWLLFT